MRTDFIMILVTVLFVSIYFVFRAPQEGSGRFDERQNRIRARAWKTAFAVFASWSIVSWWVFASVEAFEPMLAICLGGVGLAVSFAVMELICILGGAFNPVGSEKGELRLFGPLIVLGGNLASSLVISGRNPDAGSGNRLWLIMYGAVLVIFLAVALAGTVKLLADKRRDKREAGGPDE